jgi:hypothetical protein
MANNTFYFDPSVDENATGQLARTPWNNKIFPGNYVAHLNAYRDQGVLAIPGAVFFRAIGALVLNPDNKSVMNTDGVLEAGEYDLHILSPDLRQDDKPRKDRPFEIPGGAKIYRVAVNAPGVREDDSLKIDDGTGNMVYPGTTTITVNGITAPVPPVLTANDGETQEEGRSGTRGFYNPVGVWNDPMLSIVDTASTGDLIVALPDGPAGDPLPVTVTTSADLVAALDPSAGACRNSPSAILVEVCYFMPDAAPDADDVHIPYAVEAGQGY